MKNLKRLSLLFLKTSVDLPREIAKFSALEELSIGCPQTPEYAKLSRCILELPKLSALNLERFDLSDRSMSDDIIRNRQINQLELDDCLVSSIPENETYSHFERLRLQNNPIRSLPKSLFYAQKMRGLSLYGLDLSKGAAEEIGNLIELSSLVLANCSLAQIPTSIFALGKLEFLNLAGNAIEELPSEVSSLKRLRWLRISGNKLRRLPRALVDLGRLERLDLEGNPIDSVPPEILAQGVFGIQEYLSAIAETAVERLFEAKLLIVGEGGVGKTHLANELVEAGYHQRLAGKGVRSTEGIDILKWDLATDVSPRFRINVWDFGGQEIYHATHQFFLTKRSLYLFVWDARKQDRVSGFDYWLNVVRLLGDGSSIIIVLNRIDERTREIDEVSLKTHFPDVREFHKVSALQGTGMDTLRSRVVATILKLPHVGDEWPVKWSGVRRRLEKDRRNFIGRDKYEQICDEEELPVSQRSSLASYLHDLGVILHFQDDPVLQHILILKPAWGTNAVYRVLDTAKVQNEKGRFTLKDLGEIWSGEEYPPSTHTELLQLMMKFELCFPLGGAAYVAPELLSADAPSLPWESTRGLIFEYRYVFMPAGIITRFIARNHSQIEEGKYWRNGVVLVWRDTRALV